MGIVAQVFDGATSRLYVNSKTAITGTTGTGPTTTMANLRIGNNSGATGSFIGDMAYLRVIAEPLTQAEIAAEMTALAARYGIGIS